MFGEKEVIELFDKIHKEHPEVTVVHVVDPVTGKELVLTDPRKDSQLMQSLKW